MQSYDVVIIGAGAAGLMCAAQAAYRGRRVLVLDHAPKAAAKIRISGGGKCNFTNLNVKPENYITHNPHFVKSALVRYPSSQFIELVERHAIEYEERDHGQLFTRQGAGQIIQMLRQECDWAGAHIQLNTHIKQVEAQESAGFLTQSSEGTYVTQSLVIATGGLAYPKLKASDFGYKIARQFGLNVMPSRPGLVPLVFKSSWQDWFRELSGLSMDVEITTAGHHFREAMLITHQGISGPAVLQASNYWQPGQAIDINLLPEKDALTELKQLKSQSQSLSKWLSQLTTKRFSQAWLARYPLNKPLAECSEKMLQEYAHGLSQWRLYPEDTAGYDKAEVSLGGVDTDEVSSKTFESHKQPGLYFIGEVLDVTGHLGGFNFQWAWASAVACAQAL